MRATETYRSARRNKPAKKKGRSLNREFRRLSGSNHKLDFPTEKTIEVPNEFASDGSTRKQTVPFITYVSHRQRGKSYPYGSTRQGYPAAGPVVTLNW